MPSSSTTSKPAAAGMAGAGLSPSFSLAALVMVLGGLALVGNTIVGGLPDKILGLAGVSGKAGSNPVGSALLGPLGSALAGSAVSGLNSLLEPAPGHGVGLSGPPPGSFSNLPSSAQLQAAAGIDWSKVAAALQGEQSAPLAAGAR